MMLRALLVLLLPVWRALSSIYTPVLSRRLALTLTLSHLVTADSPKSRR